MNFGKYPLRFLGIWLLFRWFKLRPWCWHSKSRGKLPTEASSFSETVASVKRKTTSRYSRAHRRLRHSSHSVRTHLKGASLSRDGHSHNLVCIFIAGPFQSQYKLLFCMCESSPAHCEVERCDFNRLCVDFHRSSHTNFEKWIRFSWFICPIQTLCAKGRVL